jgi:hypothetical protein
MTEISERMSFDKQQALQPSRVASTHLPDRFVSLAAEILTIARFSVLALVAFITPFVGIPIAERFSRVRAAKIRCCITRIIIDAGVTTVSNLSIARLFSVLFNANRTVWWAATVLAVASRRVDAHGAFVALLPPIGQTKRSIVGTTGIGLAHSVVLVVLALEAFGALLARLGSTKRQVFSATPVDLWRIGSVILVVHAKWSWCWRDIWWIRWRRNIRTNQGHTRVSKSIHGQLRSASNTIRGSLSASEILTMARFSVLALVAFITPFVGIPIAERFSHVSTAKIRCRITRIIIDTEVALIAERVICRVLRSTTLHDREKRVSFGKQQAQQPFRVMSTYQIGFPTSHPRSFSAPFFVFWHS